MDSGIVIREAAVTDVADLEKIWSTWYIHSALERSLTGGLTYLVAVADGHAIGQLCIDRMSMPGSAYIFAVSVAPEYQGRGIGTRLLVVAEERAAAERVRSLALKVEHSNPRAQALYERLGYRVVDDGFDEWDERLADGTVTGHVKVATWLMRKPVWVVSGHDGT